MRSVVSSVRLPTLHDYSELTGGCEGVSKVVSTKKSKVLGSEMVVGKQAEVLCRGKKAGSGTHDKRHPWRTLADFITGKSHEHRSINIALPVSASILHSFQHLQIRSM